MQQINSPQIPLIILCVYTNNISTNAVKTACYEAQRQECHLQILSVIEASHRNFIFGSKAIGGEKRRQIENQLKFISEAFFAETAITPIISIREGDTLTEIISELKSSPNCITLILSKSYNTMSDNSLLPKLVGQIGNKIRVPVKIIPEIKQ